MSVVLLAATLASILALTGLAWLARMLLLPRLCPLCAGVTGTWAGLLTLHWAGTPVDLRLPALLLGGTVTGLAGVGDAALAGRAPAAVLAWKTFFVAVGMATAYLLLAEAWPGVAVGLALLAVLFAVPRLSAPKAAPVTMPEGRKRLLAQLKNCC